MLPQLLQTARRPAVDGAGMLLASPILPNLGVRGPVGTAGCQVPGRPPAGGAGEGAGAAGVVDWYLGAEL